MNNIELEQKIQEIIKMDSYCDMQIAIKQFQKQYKQTDFYKNTHMPLQQLVKESRLHYALQLKDLAAKLQELLDTLSFDKLNEMFDKAGKVYAEENNQTLEMFKEFKEFMK